MQDASSGAARPCHGQQPYVTAPEQRRDLAQLALPANSDVPGTGRRTMRRLRTGGYSSRPSW